MCKNADVLLPDVRIYFCATALVSFIERLIFYPMHLMTERCGGSVSIQKKLVLLISSICLIMLLILSTVGYVFIDKTSTDMTKITLDTTQSAVQYEIEGYLKSVEVAGSLISRNFDLMRGLQHGNDDVVERILTEIGPHLDGVDSISVLRADGSLAATTNVRNMVDYIDAGAPFIVTPLKTQKAIKGLHLAGKETKTLVSVATTPLIIDDTFVGIVVVANQFNTRAIDLLKERCGVEITIFADDMRITTSILRNGQRFVNTPLGNQEIYDAVINKDQMFFGKNTINNIEYDTIYWAWKDFSLKNKGFFFVGMSREAIVKNQRSIISMFLLCGGITTILLMLVGLYFAKTLTTPLRQLTSFSQEVAGGNFDDLLQIETKDEVGTLSCAINEMISQIKQKITETEEQAKETAVQAERATIAMTEAKQAHEEVEQQQVALLNVAEEVDSLVAQLNTAVGALAKQTDVVSGIASNQRSQVSSSAVAMTEMSATIHEIARSASMAVETSGRAQQSALSGEETVKDSIASITNVQQETQHLSAIVQELSKEAEAIGSILTMISDIADQTNLLALNAAIEAARAGDAGRGFAVVADEVRKLAEKTMEATQEVDKAIAQVQEKTKSSLMSVESTQKELSESVVYVQESGELLAVIVSETSDTSDQMNNIATAAEEQSSASDEISSLLNQIDSQAEETAEGMVHSSDAVQQLSMLTAQVQSMMQKLRNQA